MLQIFKFFILLFLLIVTLKFIFVVYHWQIKVLGNLGEENKIYPQSPIEYSIIIFKRKSLLLLLILKCT